MNRSSKTEVPSRKVTLRQVCKRIEFTLKIAAGLLVIISGVSMILLIASEIFHTEEFLITEVRLPAQFEANGYTGRLVARKVSYKIEDLVNQVPEKLTELFASGQMTESEKNTLQRAISTQYRDERPKIALNLRVNMVELPLDRFILYLKGWLGVDVNTIEGGITIQGTTLTSDIGLFRNGIPTAHETFKEPFDSNDPNSIYQALDNLIAHAGVFVLKSNDPLIAILQDSSEPIAYSSADKLWETKFYSDSERFETLKKITEGVEQHTPCTRKWAHGILAIFLENKEDLKGAQRNFEKSVHIDPNFIGTVGIRLANLQKDIDPSAASKTLEKMVTVNPSHETAFDQFIALLELRRETMEAEESAVFQARMHTELVDSVKRLLLVVRSDSHRHKLHKSLIDIHGTMKGYENEFYESLKLALLSGMPIDEEDLDFPPYDIFSGQSKFQELIKPHLSKAKQKNEQ